MISDWMIRIESWLARGLDAREREYVLGDLDEERAGSLQRLRAVSGLLARRQSEAWRGPGPWLAVTGVVGLSGVAMAGLARAITTDLSLHFAAWRTFGVRYRTGLTGWEELFAYAVLATAILVWAWTAGFAVRRISGRAWVLTSAALACVWAFSGWELLLVFPAWLGARRARPGDWPVAAGIIGVAAFALALLAMDLRLSGIERWAHLSWRPAPRLHDGAGLLLAAWPALYILVNARLATARSAAALLGIALMAFSAPTTLIAEEGAKAVLVQERSRRPAPEFSVPGADGRTIRLRDLRGKIVLVNFWATYCVPCKVELPWLEEYERKWKAQGFAVVALALDEGGLPVVKRYLQDRGFTFRVGASGDPLADRYGAQVTPATYLVDQQGRIAAEYAGLVDRHNLESNIQRLMRR